MSAGFRSWIAGVVGRFSSVTPSGTGDPPLMCNPVIFDIAMLSLTTDLQVNALGLDLTIRQLTLNPEFVVITDLAIPVLSLNCGA